MGQGYVGRCAHSQTSEVMADINKDARFRPSVDGRSGTASSPVWGLPSAFSLRLRLAVPGFGFLVRSSGFTVQGSGFRGARWRPLVAKGRPARYPERPARYPARRVRYRCPSRIRPSVLYAEPRSLKPKTLTPEPEGAQALSSKPVGSTPEHETLHPTSCG